MKIYYAHPMSWYGTDREDEDLACLADNTPLHSEIVNPNSKPFREAVATCDAIAYRTFDDGSIGARVANELLTAAIHGKQIFRLRTSPARLIYLQEERGLGASFGPRLLTITQTRDYIKRGVM